jgi:serine/threonine-protein kinase
MPLEPGSRLGVYEIGDALGAGGMGVVYRARDSKLGRRVAIKVLADTVAGDADRIARFEREARALAALNHPHIASLYGMEQAGEQHFLVMELVEGDTLDTRLPMSVDEALAMARQIAEAVEAAHENGIIHRDLKPANIKITPHNQVKLLDFGLAKAMAPVIAANDSITSDASPPSETRNAVATEVGIVLGTAAYMSPEQARGKPVDRRTDIWAFGCVLYEMLTGKRAIAAGESVSDVIATILTGDIDWSALPSHTPPRIRALLRRCLEKDPQRRLPHIGVARLDIDEGSDESATAALFTTPGRRPSWRRTAGIIGAVLVTGAVAAFAGWALKPANDPVVTRFTITLPESHAFTNTGRQVISFSPDGSQIVYVANRRLYVRTLWDEEPRPLAGTDGDQGVFHPVFSPDGRSIAFVAGSELKHVALAGGTATTMASLSGGVFGLSWSGDHLVYGEAGTTIRRVATAGGAPEVLVRVEAPAVVSSPSILPGGKHLLFTQANLTNSADRWDKARVIVQSLESGEQKTVVETGSDGRLLPSGHLVYAVGGVVYGAPFDLDSLSLRGTPVPMIEGLRRGGPTGAAQFAVSATGSVAYLPGTTSAASESELFLTDARGNTGRLNVRGGHYEQPRLSPDGTQVAFHSVEPRVTSVWVYDLSGASAMRRLTLEGNNKYPVWSSDGQRVAFQSDREGDLAIFSQRADGTGLAERLTRAEPGTAHIPHSSDPSGAHLLYSSMTSNTATLWIYSFRDRRAEQIKGITSTLPFGATFSPDGRLITYYANDDTGNGGSRVFVMPFPPDGTKYQVSGGIHPMWSGDGRQLFMPRTQGRMGAVAISTQPTFRFGEVVEISVRAIGATAPEAARAFDIGRDGTMLGVVTAGNLDALTDNRKIRVVLNWGEELKRSRAAR